jgi:hypothetical protein
MGTVFSLSKIQQYEIGRSSFSRSTKTRKSAQCAGAYIRKIGLDKNSEKIRNAEMGNS